MFDAAHGEHRSSIRRGFQRGGEHDGGQRSGNVGQFVNGAHADHRAGDFLVERRPTEAVPIALDDRHQPVAVVGDRRRDEGFPSGAVNGEANSHAP